MMSMVGAAVAPDTTAALVLAHSWGDRRRRFFEARQKVCESKAGTFAAVHESLGGPSRHFAAMQRLVRYWMRSGLSQIVHPSAFATSDHRTI